MKRRSFFAALAAPLTMLWPRSKTPKQTKPSPAEMFGAAHEAGVEFGLHFTRQAVILARTPRYGATRVWPYLTQGSGPEAFTGLAG